MKHALILSLLAAPALADERAAVHVHPHGGEAVLAGLAILAAAWAAWRWVR